MGCTIIWKIFENGLLRNADALTVNIENRQKAQKYDVYDQNDLPKGNHFQIFFNTIFFITVLLFKSFEILFNEAAVITRLDDVQF